MFSLFSFDKVKKFLFAGFILLAIAAIMSGCSTDPDDDTNVPGALPAALIGKWVPTNVGGDYYEITNAGGAQTLKYEDGGYGFGYQGSIEFVSNFDSKTGVIIIKYNDNTNKNKPNPFHALYYLKLTDTGSVELNNTSDLANNYADADTTTLNEAINKFTRGNMSNYIDLAWSATYTKQP